MPKDVWQYGHAHGEAIYFNAIYFHAVVTINCYKQSLTLNVIIMQAVVGYTAVSHKVKHEVKLGRTEMREKEELSKLAH